MAFTEDWKELTKRLDYYFKDVRLLFEALTHPSCLVNNPNSDFKSYQRLEFIGDRVIELITAEILFRTYNDAGEGDLTVYINMLVNNNRLAVLARKLELGKYLRINKSRECQRLREDEYVLACAFEALCGAIFIDSGGGFLKVKQILGNHLFEGFTPALAAKREFDPKSYLQNIAQRKFKCTPSYRIINMKGGDKTVFTVGVYLCDVLIGEGNDRYKHKAEKNAALNVLKATRDLSYNLPFELVRQRNVLGEILFTRDSEF